jgi:polar amino acid transport system permease protein
MMMLDFIDMNFITNRVMPYLDRGLLMSLQLIVPASLIGGFIGVVMGVLRVFGSAPVRHATDAFVAVVRGIPLTVQLMILYFGLPKVGVKLDAETCAVAGLTFLGGAYMAESLRSGLESVDRVQQESGMCIGLTPLQNLCYVILPQGLATAIPSIGANAVFLIKETSVFSAVALADLMYVAKDLIGMYYKTDEALLMLTLAYLTLLLPISIAFTLLERRLRHAGFGGAV